MRSFAVSLICLFLVSPVYGYTVGAVKVESGNITASIGSSVTGGTVATTVNSLTSAPVAKQLSTITTAINRVIIRPASTNILDVYVGNSEVEPTRNGIQLGNGQAVTGNCVTLNVDSLADIYINCVTGNQVVNYLAELK